MPRDQLPALAFGSARDWEDWLAAHHLTSPGLWLKLAKKGAGITTVSYAEAVQTALCFGWIDGMKDSLDADYWLQRFTRRRPRSRWSRVNRDSAEQLIAAGRMRPAGLAEVERARADGRWAAAYEPQAAITVPDDLAAALAANPDAAAFFATLRGANRYAVLYRIQDAKRPQTRAARIAAFVQMLAEHKTLH